jgi:hypothetical protein
MRALIKRLMAIVVCCSAVCAAQQVTAILPDNYKTVLTSGPVKVMRVHYGPHEKVPVHLHPEVPTVYVYLNNSGQVQLTHYVDEKVSEVVMRPPTHKGAYRVSAGKIETHSVENLSDLPSDFLRVELPGFHVEKPDLEFRGKAPEDLSHDVSATEFEIPGLTVGRAVCVDAKPCEVQRPVAQAVVVAFSDVVLQEGAQGKKTEMKLGDVLAVPAGESLSLAKTGSEPAHVLMISVSDAAAAK